MAFTAQRAAVPRHATPHHVIWRRQIRECGCGGVFSRYPVVYTDFWTFPRLFGAGWKSRGHRECWAFFRSAYSTPISFRSFILISDSSLGGWVAAWQRATVGITNLRLRIRNNTDTRKYATTCCFTRIRWVENTRTYMIERDTRTSQLHEDSNLKFRIQQDNFIKTFCMHIAFAYLGILE